MAKRNVGKRTGPLPNPNDRKAMAREFGVEVWTPLNAWRLLQFNLQTQLLVMWVAKSLGRTDIETVSAELLSGKLDKQAIKLTEADLDALFTAEVAHEMALLMVQNIQSSFHEVSNLFPEISSVELDRLVEDVKKHGLKDPV